MSKLDDMNKVTVPDPLTGGNQTIYTSKDGTFMMCIPDRCTPDKVPPMPTPIITNISDDGKTKVWTWEMPRTDI
jgi:hypothetical protein